MCSMSYSLPRVHNNGGLSNAVKFETGRNLLPVLKIVTCTAKCMTGRVFYFQYASLILTGLCTWASIGVTRSLHV